MSALGVYVGNDPAAVRAFETWMGRPVDAVLAYVGRDGWADVTGSARWAAGLWAGIDRPILWSVPLVANGASLAHAAAGAYDAHYREVAVALAATRPGDETIAVRTGWEFNAGWFPWGAIGREEAYVGAFARFVDVFRSVSDRFRFEWSPNIGDMGMNPERAYPGDDRVDVIGLDVYHQPRWDPADPQAAWTHMVERPYGLRWHQEFAAAHGKPTAYSEWGVTTADAAPYVANAAAWFARHDVLYHAYWDSDADYRGRLSGDRHPETGAAFRAAFADADGGAVAGTVGADRLAGGPGPDTFVIDHPGDAIVAAGGGEDGVRSRIDSYALPDGLVWLTLVGPEGRTGIGNALANRITGGAGSDTLDGGAGDDVLLGGPGNDAFVVRPGGGRDTVLDFAAGPGAGDVLALDGFGFAGFAEVRARMEAFGGDTVLSLPGGGVVVLRGRAVADFAADDVITAGAPPVPPPPWRPDPPPAAPTGVERSRTGGPGSDTLAGDGRNDFLDGAGGADTLIGGAGHDVYVVDRADDAIVEHPGGGIDTVQSWSRTYALPAEVEHIVLYGSYDQTAVGNALANRIAGGSGADTLDGGPGDDRLTGNGGADRFVIRAGNGRDTITDFGPGDRLVLDGTGLGSPAAARAAFAAVEGGTVLTLPDGGTVYFPDRSPGGFAADGLVVRGDAAAPPSNRAPEAGEARAVRLEEDAPATPLALPRPRDPDGDPLAVTVTGLPGGATVRLADGRALVPGMTLGPDDLPGLAVAPAPGAHGALGVFAYTVADGRGGVAARAVPVEAVALAERLAGFDPLAYLSGHPDLAAAFGADEAAARTHFVTHGRFEGRERTGIDPLRYAAGHPDLALAYGADATAALRHYVLWGRAEGRRADAFDGLDYVASHPDLMDAFGADAERGVLHYLLWGAREGRSGDFDGVGYLAANRDLVAAFGDDPDRATAHWIETGRHEGRPVRFDGDAYRALYPDVAEVFPDGAAAARHYIRFGVAEGRTPFPEPLSAGAPPAEDGAS